MTHDDLLELPGVHDEVLVVGDAHKHHEAHSRDHDPEVDEVHEGVRGEGLEERQDGGIDSWLGVHLGPESHDFVVEVQKRNQSFFADPR